MIKPVPISTPLQSCACCCTDMYIYWQVVAEVDHYKEFVPWCVGSSVFERQDGHAKASLKIGK